MKMCKNIQWWYQTAVIETRPVTHFIFTQRLVRRLLTAVGLSDVAGRPVVSGGVRV